MENKYNFNTKLINYVLYKNGGTLKVALQNGHTYGYQMIDKSTVDGLFESSDKDNYYIVNIDSNKLFRKIIIHLV